MNTPHRQIPFHRLQTQAAVSAEIVTQTLSQTLLSGKPADRCLKDAFYANRQLGSRDRRLINETLFAALRWWGWLRRLAPRPFVEAWEKRRDCDAAIPTAHWHKVLVGAWLLESPPEVPAAVHTWAESLEPTDLELNFTRPDAPWQEKWNSLTPLLYPAKNPQGDLLELVPDWALPLPAEEEGIDWEDLISWLQKRPPLWLRAQISDVAWLRRELEGQGAKARPHTKMPYALECEASSLNLRAMPSFRHGDFEVQDLASQCVALVCDPKPGEQWWDACAGGGGKTLHLAWLMQGKGSVTASDIRLYKLDELKLRARRAQFPNIRCKEWKGREMPKWKDRFNGVLVDTPCSCSGTWRRNPDARWNSQPEELTEFTRLQKQLLENASGAVKPGGTLVYSTCSMFKAENQDIIEAFLAENPHFELCPYISPIDQKECNGMRQIWPADGNCDSMFTAKMKRRL